MDLRDPIDITFIHLYSTLSQKDRQEDRQYNINIEIKTQR